MRCRLYSDRADRIPLGRPHDRKASSTQKLAAQWTRSNFFELVVGGPAVLDMDVLRMITHDRELHGMVSRGTAFFSTKGQPQAVPILE